MGNWSSALLLFPALILLSAFAAGILTLTLLLILLIARLALFLSLLGPLLGSLLVLPLSLVLLILILILIAHGHSSFAIVSQQWDVVPGDAGCVQIRTNRVAARLGLWSC
jgi:hypothetical protein